MDLIYTDSARQPIGVIRYGELDMAFGSDENDFELSLEISQNCCVQQGFIYLEDADTSGQIAHTEYGGIIDTVKVNTAEDTVTYSGRTWHGILEGKIICPDSGKDYLVLTGEANSVLSGLITRIGLGSLFAVSAEDSGITISSYQMERYVAAYTGIRKMVASAGAKLKLRYEDGKVSLSAVPVVDYTQDEEWDSDQMDFVIGNNVRAVNHLICLGKGELKDRIVVHLYADASGAISTTQTFTGTDEVTAVYDYSSAEEDELETKGTEKLQEYVDAANSLEVQFENSADYDIGDIVGAREIVTGTQIRCSITKKIVTIDENGINIECQIGE